MANPFKEADKAKKKAPGNVGVEPAKEVKTLVVNEEKKAAEVVPVKEEKPVEKTVKKEQSVSNVLAGLKDFEKTPAKTHAFYLSDENVEKLKAAAKKKGVSASKLLDHILSEIF